MSEPIKSPCEACGSECGSAYFRKCLKWRSWFSRCWTFDRNRIRQVEAARDIERMNTLKERTE